jgi:dTDP-4-dehydrorhamnose reductase
VVVTLRLAVTGLKGQVVTALIERSPKDVEIIALGRPQLDLELRGAVIAGLRHARCDAIINAAAYTAVDKAETEPDVAMRINGEGAGHVAEAAAELGVPLLHLSTEYVFDGRLERPYRETDPTAPLSAYGRSKLRGEERIMAIHGNHVILRTSWVYSPFGENFVRTMLRLGSSQEEVAVVSDQLGNPTSAVDIAGALVVIARQLVSDNEPSLRGIFHMTGQGEGSWADVAEAIFAAAEARGFRPARVKRIATADYPTLARRPANSRLDNEKLAARYGLSLPPWREALADCVGLLLQPPAGPLQKRK